MGTELSTQLEIYQKPALKLRIKTSWVPTQAANLPLVFSTKTKSKVAGQHRKQQYVDLPTLSHK